MVGAHRLWIHENLILALKTLPPVDDEQILVRAALHEKVVAVAFHGNPNSVHFHQLGEAFGNLCPSRKGAEHRVSAAVLGINPRAGFRTILILKPAVGVSDRDAVNRLDYIIRARWRRTFFSGNLFLCRGQSGNETRDSRQCKDRQYRSEDLKMT